MASALRVNLLGMRKAIHLLRAMGVVETKSGCGTFVTTSPPTLELEALTLLAPLQSFSPRESWVARRLLEVSLVGLAARNASGDDFARLVEEVMVSATLYDVRRETIGRLQDLRQSVEMHRNIYSAVRLRSEENTKAAMSEHLICAEQDIVSQDPAFDRET